MLDEIKDHIVLYFILVAKHSKMIHAFPKVLLEVIERHHGTLPLIALSSLNLSNAHLK